MSSSASRDTRHDRARRRASYATSSKRPSMTRCCATRARVASIAFDRLLLIYEFQSGKIAVPSWRDDRDLDPLATVHPALAFRRSLRELGNHACGCDSARPENFSHDVPVFLIARHANGLLRHSSSLAHAIGDRLEYGEPNHVGVELANMLADEGQRWAACDDFAR